MTDIITPASELKVKLEGLLGPGEPFRRFFLTDNIVANLPKDPNVRMQVYHYEIAPGAFTNWHCHNGPTFFVCLQGEFEAHFEEGVLVRAKAGDVYSEPIAKMHRGHNPRSDIANIGVGFSLTSTDREPVTNVVQPW